MMEWLNLFGLVFTAVLMIPNIVFALRHKGEFVHTRGNKAAETVEQIGRFGCIAFMIVNIPGTWFGCWSDEVFAVYLMADAALALVYCAAWVALRKKRNVFRALVLSALPAALFLLSGVLMRSVPLIVSALLFAPAHILISYTNAEKPQKNDQQIINESETETEDHG